MLISEQIEDVKKWCVFYIALSSTSHTSCESAYKNQRRYIFRIEESQILTELNDNNISMISLGSFITLFNLEALDLYGNELTVLDRDVVSRLPKLRVLNLSDNQMGCEFFHSPN